MNGIFFLLPKHRTLGSKLGWVRVRVHEWENLITNSHCGLPKIIPVFANWIWDLHAGARTHTASRCKPFLRVSTASRCKPFLRVSKVQERCKLRWSQLLFDNRLWYALRNNQSGNKFGNLVSLLLLLLLAWWKIKVIHNKKKPLNNVTRWRGKDTSASSISNIKPSRV
jgi:hypothetical protein